MEITKLVGGLVALSFFITITLAILFYDNYVFFEQYLSELGAGETAFIFNIGIMITALLMLVLYYLMYFKNNKTNFAIGILSAVFLFGVGLFPLTIKLPHYLSAALFFLLSFLLITKSVINLYLQKKKIGFIGIISIIVILLYMFIFKIPIMQKLSVLVIIIWLTSKIFLKKY